MKTFEFKSAICTTKEQSERLLALGLKKETADMCWTLVDIDREGNNYSVEYMSIGQGKYQLLHPDWYTPAWSLARLFEISNSAIHIGLPALIDRQQPYDYLITTIEDYIKHNCFNKDYLEKRK